MRSRLTRHLNLPDQSAPPGATPEAAALEADVLGAPDATDTTDELHPRRLAHALVKPGGVAPAGLISHDPPFAAHEEAIYLLHIAAEVEHALMVQYLYAAFSLGGPQVAPEHQASVKRWRDTIVGIAREEMGHLATVENILQLIGGPLTFEREDFPIPAGLYPFPFCLEPLTLHSLAKYVVAEMPDLSTFDDEPELKAEMEQIIQEATAGNEGQAVNRVGILYERAIALMDQVLTVDFNRDSVSYQVKPSEWGLNYPHMLVETASDRASAKNALSLVAEQGEAPPALTPAAREVLRHLRDPLPGPAQALTKTAGADEPSHFVRFLTVYREFAQIDGWTATCPVPVNPTTDRSRDVFAANIGKPDDDPTRLTPITNPEACVWAQLFNLRYRMVLMYLGHSFTAASTTSDGDTRNPRGLLVSWSFGEMYHIRSIADILTGLPLHAHGSLDQVAAAPFEMPYSLALPLRELDRWRQHRDLIESCTGLIDRLIARLSAAGPQRHQHLTYLRGMRKQDQQTLNVLNTVIVG